MSIKYYHLAKGEIPPEEFCAVRDVGGEPSEYVFYVPESDVAKLRELVDAWMGCGTRYHTMKGCCPMFDENAKDFCKAEELARELGIEVR
jgi:hypothetical protein